jgi:hypothetical protein
MQTLVGLVRLMRGPLIGHIHWSNRMQRSNVAAISSAMDVRSRAFMAREQYSTAQ